MEELTRLGLVTYNKKAKMYAIQDKGNRYMEIYSVLRAHMGDDDT